MARKILVAIPCPLAIFVVLAILRMPRVSEAATNSYPAPRTGKAPIDLYIDEITFFQDQLKSTDLPSESRKLIEHKLGVVSMMATQRASVKGGTTNQTRYDASNINI